LEYDFPEKFFPKARDLVEKLLVSIGGRTMQASRAYSDPTLRMTSLGVSVLKERFV
jgi:hypothetical protein